MSKQGHPARAAGEALRQAMKNLKPEQIHLAFLFMSPHHAIAADDVLGTILPRLRGATLLGCTSQGTVGGEQEIEQGPALSLWLAQLDGATVNPFELTVQATPDGEAVVGLPLVTESMRAMILLADPYTFPTQVVLESLNTVSQGCKPIGEPYVVTGVQGNIIWELGGKPPLHRLRETLEKLSLEERDMASQNKRDFLIRGVLQADPQTGAMSVGEALTLGQTVQFQMRDAATADADLKSLLEDRLESGKHSPPAGALMFTCNGRGVGLFGTPNHDVVALRSAFADLPVAGMFCGGEIGPIGGVNFLHGFTASVALFEDSQQTSQSG
jgi:small ligand-binding sensory domain FIST